jgi:hypothetical protein
MAEPASEAMSATLLTMSLLMTTPNHARSICEEIIAAGRNIYCHG